jgi:pimeloyl-ACP methyl ester carboxylesterase
METARTLGDGGREARALHGAIEASYATGLAGEAARAPVPVDAIWGEQDRMVPVADAAVLARAVPSADIRFLPGCGHLPMVERPEAFALALAGLARI